jgi:hypothetical protein
MISVLTDMTTKNVKRAAFLALLLCGPDRFYLIVRKISRENGCFNFFAFFFVFISEQNPKTITVKIDSA